jgi:hypothetical protein
MRKRLDLHTEAGIARQIICGRGQGVGSDYLPWITVHDLPSKGYRTALYSHRLKRVVHLLSLLELGTFVIAESNPRFVEIYEQCPLDRQRTRDIACSMGIKHPQVNGVDIVMTSDLKIIEDMGCGNYRSFVWSSKYSDELRRWRPVEKLMIEKNYQKSIGDGFQIITEESFPRALIMNLRMLRVIMRPGMMDGFTEPLLKAIGDFMDDRIWNVPFADLCAMCDRSLSLPMELRSMRAAHALIASGRWRVDLRQLIEPHLPLSRLP